MALHIGRLSSLLVRACQLSRLLLSSLSEEIERMCGGTVGETTCRGNRGSSIALSCVGECILFFMTIVVVDRRRLEGPMAYALLTCPVLGELGFGYDHRDCFDDPRSKRPSTFSK